MKQFQIRALEVDFEIQKAIENNSLTKINLGLNFSLVMISQVTNKSIIKEHHTQAKNPAPIYRVAYQSNFMLQFQ
jgi:hypothetical protein